MPESFAVLAAIGGFLVSLFGLKWAITTLFGAGAFDLLTGPVVVVSFVVAIIAAAMFIWNLT